MKILKKLKILFVLSLILSSLTVIILYLIFDNEISSQLEKYAHSFCANKINAQINTAILNEIANCDLSYDKIIKIEKDTSGKLISVGADMIEVSKLKSRLELEISEICESLDYYYLKIPIGNLLGDGLFYGRGFDITVKFKPIGYSDARMRGELATVGINQSIYRISFDTIAKVGVVFPFKYIEIPVEVENVLTETVILGDVPESFTHFDLQGDITTQDFQGYVEDYMAE